MPTGDPIETCHICGGWYYTTVGHDCSNLKSAVDREGERLKAENQALKERVKKLERVREAAKNLDVCGTHGYYISEKTLSNLEQALNEVEK